MKTKEVTIRLNSVIDDVESNYTYRGAYRFHGGSHCIAYTDPMGNAVTRVGIEANERMLLLHRVGYITADMLFDPQTETVVQSYISGGTNQ